MGREEHVRKERTCKHCKRVLYRNAKELKKHSETCQAAIKLGLIIPGIEVPKVQIVIP